MSSTRTLPASAFRLDSRNQFSADASDLPRSNGDFRQGFILERRSSRIIFSRANAISDAEGETMAWRFDGTDGYTAVIYND